MSTTRRTLLAAAAAAPALAQATSGSASAVGNPSSAADPIVGTLVERAARGHAALMRGDLALYRGQLQVSPDFTLMSPFGGPPTHGGTLSADRWDAIARFFHGGRDSTLELVQSYRSQDLVVLAAVERTVAEVGGLPEQPWALRVTLVFRRERGEWQLVHRHADPLVAGISLQESAALASRPG